MVLKECDRCNEMVDEAKAFCPGCGNAFVAEEARREESKFEKMDNTVQFGQTMYNQILEDMGLNISNAPNQVEKRVETIPPIHAEPASPVKVDKSVVVSPVVATQNRQPENQKAKSKATLYIFIGLATVFLFLIALASAIFVIFEIWSRMR